MVTVNWPEWNKLVNDTFIPFLDNKSRYLILYGGRGSSKSDFAAKKLVYRCLTDDYFRFVLVRNTYATIKDSSYQTLKDTIFDLGLQELFEFKLQPLEIHCINGNSFIARGCDDTTKLKSIKDPTGVWWEEDIPDESDFITVTTGIRTTKADYLQEIFTINPEVEGDYREHWFYKRFFAKSKELSFTSTTSLKVDESTAVDLTYTVHHSTHKDNKWLPPEFRAFLNDLKLSNPYYWEIYCNGKWGNRQLGGRFYKDFDIGKNTFNYKYRPELPLHISFDFNVNPFMSCSIWQIENKSAYLIDEIATKDPDNTIKGICREFTRRYNNHQGGLFVYGDPSGKKEDVGQEKGYNYFKQIEAELLKFNPTFRVAAMAPPVVIRGQFINTIFQSRFDDVAIYLHENTTFLKDDLLYGLQDSDGTKHKQKVKGENGVSYEKYHHFSDGMDYFICMAFKESFQKYQTGSPQNFMRSAGRNAFNEKMRL